MGVTPSSLTGEDLLAFEVAAIGDRRQFAHARRFLRLLRHHRELAAIVADIGDLMRNDQVMLRIDHGLHIVADQPRVLAARRHGSRVGIG
jgi:hypothetical protein